MLDSLSDRLNAKFRKLKGHGKLTEKNIEEGLKEVRMALLEADVHYRVVKKFIAEVKERAMGQEVMQSLTPGQQVIKIVNESLTELIDSVCYSRIWKIYFICCVLKNKTFLSLTATS